MPYLGHECNSPGEIWVKTSNGWRTCRTITIKRNRMDPQNQNTDGNSSSMKENSEEASKSQGFLWQTKAPYIVLPGYSNRGPSFYFVSKRGTKTNGKYSTAGEAFQALGFPIATRDQRKFSYVCRLIELLIRTQNLSPECGTAQKHVQLTLVEIAQTALDTECNLHIAKNVVNLARERLLRDKYRYAGKHQSFDRKLNELVDLQGKLKRFKVKKLKKGITKTSLNITELPDECLGVIISCFSDHRDVCRLAKVNRQFYKLCNESSIWRGLCKFHLSKQQLDKVTVEAYPNWKGWYQKLIRQSSMREVYADILELCSHCHCMFWKGTCHPCTYDVKNSDHQPPIFIPVTPEGFFHLFES